MAECHRACVGMPSPIKIAPSHCGTWTPSNTWFFEPTQARNPKGILIDSAVFEQLMTVSSGMPRANANTKFLLQIGKCSIIVLISINQYR